MLAIGGTQGDTRSKILGFIGMMGVGSYHGNKWRFNQQEGFVGIELG
jgi:hypothetical protein